MIEDKISLDKGDSNFQKSISLFLNIYAKSHNCIIYERYLLKSIIYFKPIENKDKIKLEQKVSIFIPVNCYDFFDYDVHLG